MITGYISPDSGSIEVCNIPVSENNINTKKKIGYLPEANPLYLDMYVKEYLAFIAGLHKVPQSETRIKEVIALVGLTPESHKKTGQLSKGYKQRVGLAAALVHDPEVLILDEPTSGLDPNQIIEIREVIKKLGENKTVLFSSHIMQEVEAICERVIIINKGNIVADDKLSNLQKSNTGKHAVSVQFSEKITAESLREIKHSSAIRILPDSTFVFETDNPEAVRKELMEFSLRSNLNIITLKSESQNLESIFKTLTT